MRLFSVQVKAPGDSVFVNSLKEEINNITSCFDKEQDLRVNWEYLKYKIFRF